MYNRGNVGLVFDGSFDGFLCIIYNFYYKKICPSHIGVEDGFQPMLGIEYQQVITDYKNALTVANGIKNKISKECYRYLYTAFLNNCEDRFMDLFNYVVAGFKIGKKIDMYEQWDFVLNTHKYCQNTLRESHFFKEVIRFYDTKAKVLYAKIEPVNNVLPLIAKHFTDRLIDEKFIIHDLNRQKAIVYDTKRWSIYDTPKEAKVEKDEIDEEYQELWIAFFNAVTIEERKSDKRQKRVLPLKYRKHMIEFTTLTKNKL